MKGLPLLLLALAAFSACAQADHCQCPCFSGGDPSQTPGALADCSTCTSGAADCHDVSRPLAICDLDGLTDVEFSTPAAECDRISETVCITRGSVEAIYNADTEVSAD